MLRPTRQPIHYKECLCRSRKAFGIIRETDRVCRASIWKKGRMAPGTEEINRDVFHIGALLRQLRGIYCVKFFPQINLGVFFVCYRAPRHYRPGQSAIQFLARLYGEVKRRMRRSMASLPRNEERVAGILLYI